MDRRYNFFGHSNSKKVWFINNLKFQSDEGMKNGKQKAIAYARMHMLDEKDIKEFDSEMEFKRFLFLKKRLENGEIRELKDHFNFQLLPTCVSADGVEHEELLYEADFFYYDVVAGRYIVEDVKGFMEDVFRVKWKLFDYKFLSKGLAIACVQLRSGRGVDPLLESSWINLAESPVKKSTKRIDKLREENKLMKKEKAEREKKQRKENKERLRLAELKAKPKLTKREHERLIELSSKYDIPINNAL